MKNNILLYDKPEGISTYDIIRSIKKNYPRGTKIGHTGTLDPFATGLVIILLNEECKNQDKYMHLDKTYIAKAEFGFETDTQDITGNVVNRESVRAIPREEIERYIIENFLGEFKQTPPSYSAKHINGKRAYDLAREGKEVILEPKLINVYSFEIVDYIFPTVTFRINCSSGTYVRTLIKDLGRSLNTYATCVSLRRIQIGEYNVENSIKLELEK